ncbi:Inorganic phosphate transporter 1-1 [Quillaja saponaria]|uniref:Inorganic phosphate transporter 1-1 n=1 Tax=Quillaja saponaria TaxID=32244 RepID=A0AAD7Q0L7_QUISA|nr:Inorganic phosphate transporter 1-1 [Quillaja saponaria]
MAGMGFFTDAYDLFCMLLGRLYYQVEGSANPGSLPPNVSAAVNGVALCGTLADQLLFGLPFGHNAKSVMATLCFFWFWLGFGIRGDCPLAATITSDYANKKTQGAFIAALKKPETARYTALTVRNAQQAASDMSKVLQVDIEAEPRKLSS